MKKVSLKKCRHLGLPLQEIEFNGVTNWYGHLPAHVSAPLEHTDKEDFAYIGAPSDLYNTLKGHGEQELFEIFSDLRREIHREEILSFLEKRWRLHQTAPNSIEELRLQDEEMLKKLVNIHGSFMSFSDFVEESRQLSKKTSFKLTKMLP